MLSQTSRSASRAFLRKRQLDILLPLPNDKACQAPRFSVTYGVGRVAKQEERGLWERGFLEMS